jgi:hypothetical protein
MDHLHAEVQNHLGRLQAKITKFAERRGICASEHFDFSRTLAALSWPDRCRLRILLESVRIHVADAALQKAFDLMIQLAEAAWIDTVQNSASPESRH